MTEDYFVRVQPIVGERLRSKRVAVLNSAAAEVARLLASCRVEHFYLPPHSTALAAELRARYGTPNLHIGLEDANLRHADLLISAGDAQAMAQLAQLCTQYGVPGVGLELTAEGGVVRSFIATPHEAATYPPTTIADTQTKGETLNWLDLSHHAARLARAILLGESETAETWHIGSHDWPWRISPQPTNQPPALDSTNIAAAQHQAAPILILGCGSVGSYIAPDLALAGATQLWLLDDELVETANPARQFYTRADVDQPKATRLAANLVAVAPDCYTESLNFRYTEASTAEFANLVATIRPAVVVLATGTNADYQAARVLWQMGIAHLIARCYRRARYFEVVTVGAGTGPCYDCVRGHLYTGPSPSLTPEQRAAYDNTPLDGELAGELVSEPATLIESGWAAAVAARLTLQLAAAPEAQATWFRACVDEGATCFLGGNVAEQQNDGWAYGISRAGQVVAYGVADILGSVGAAALPCANCGQVWQPGRLI